MTKPVLGYVRARCYSETRAWDGFVKQKDHAVFTRALKQCTWYHLENTQKNLPDIVVVLLMYMWDLEQE